MEENKEILSAQGDAESIDNCDAESKTQENNTLQNSTESADNSANEEATASSFGDEIAELLNDEPQQDESSDVLPVDYEAPESAQAVPQKKKFPVQVPIMISFFIVLAVALTFFIIKGFFDTSIIGTWSIESSASADEVNKPDISYKVYYSFLSDGKYKVNMGTNEEVGTYTLSTNEEGEPTVTIGSDTMSAQEYNYKVTGNIFTGKKLTLSVPSYNFSQDLKSDRVVIPKLKVSKDFKANDKLTGEWVYNDGYYNFAYTFNDDGTVKVNSNNISTLSGVYTCKDNVITITYFSIKEESMDLPFSFNGDDEIILNNLQFFRAGSASADEAAKAMQQNSQNNAVAVQ